MENYVPGIGFAAGGMMVQWKVLNSHLNPALIKCKPGDHVNVFINFESVLYNLTLQKNLSNMIHFHKQSLVIELESAILNLMGIYKAYFKTKNVIPRIYFYHTNLLTNAQQMYSYNKFYRTYYKNRYMQNPQFKSMGDVLNAIIIPEIKLITSYIPNCYFLESTTFDGSIIPKIVSEFSECSANIIISSDVFDTLYIYNPNFSVVYIKRRYSVVNIYSEISEIVQSILKEEDPFDATIFNSQLYYRLLLSIKGSKIRNVKSAKGFGYGKFMKILKDGLYKGIVLKDFESIDSILQLFPNKYQDDIKSSFQCMDIETQYALLNEVDISHIKDQLVERSDVPSLETLNNKRFLDSPINLSNLLE